MHSPPRKLSAKDQADWRIPPCISNWKNPKGHTIPLDKRLAADGRGLQTTHLNEKFAQLSEALYIADRKAREAVETRAQIEEKLAQRQKEKKEEELRVIAQKAREERAGIRRTGTISYKYMYSVSGVIHAAIFSLKLINYYEYSTKFICNRIFWSLPISSYIVFIP